MAVAHYLEALKWQRDVIRIHAVLGGKNPHPQTYVVGGMATPLDPNSPQAINDERIDFMRARIQSMRDFVEQVYLPDVLAVASAYPEWLEARRRARRTTCPTAARRWARSTSRRSYLFPRGIVLDRDLTTVHPFDQAKSPSTSRTPGTSTPATAAPARHPYDGETRPHYTGPRRRSSSWTTDHKYSWLKAPRYDGQVMEVGPLARTLVVLCGRQGLRQASRSTDAAGQAEAPAPPRSSPRSAASRRGRSSPSSSASRLEGWLDELRDNMHAGDLRIADETVWDRDSWPDKAAAGAGTRRRAARSGTGSRSSDGEIANYQAVVPTTWNSGPRDSDGQPGPYELALVGTPVADPKQPLEILRTVHSFDPCMACAVHVLDPRAPDGAAVTVESRGWW